MTNTITTLQVMAQILHSNSNLYIGQTERIIDFANGVQIMQNYGWKRCSRETVTEMAYNVSIDEQQKNLRISQGHQV